MSNTVIIKTISHEDLVVAITSVDEAVFGDMVVAEALDIARRELTQSLEKIACVEEIIYVDSVLRINEHPLFTQFGMHGMPITQVIAKINNALVEYLVPLGVDDVRKQIRG